VHYVTAPDPDKPNFITILDLGGNEDTQMIQDQYSKKTCKVVDPIKLTIDHMLNYAGREYYRDEINCIKMTELVKNTKRFRHMLEDGRFRLNEQLTLTVVPDDDDDDWMHRIFIYTSMVNGTSGIHRYDLPKKFPAQFYCKSG
jgi:hypothetical protein